MTQQSDSSTPTRKVGRRYATHKLELVAGVVAICFGLLYLFVGVPGSSQTGTGTVQAGEVYKLSVHYAYSLEDEVRVSIHWSAAINISVYLYSCGTDASCSGLTSPYLPPQSGTGGQFTFTGLKGHTFALVTDGEAMFAYSSDTPYPFFWLALPPLVSGAVVAVYAVVAKPRSEVPDSEQLPMTEVEPLLAQLKENGVVAAYRCPSCRAIVKVSGDTPSASLATCEGCHKAIDPRDLKEMLETALA